jgi:8-oxo-dGTP pyrophosphatase MutT (NUDIX family)
MKKASCGIFVLSASGELLLCHATGTSRWDIPKGAADAGESQQQTALRETAEETGLRFEPDNLMDLGRFTYLPAKDLHLYATLVERFDPALCTCTTFFRDARGRLLPEMDRYAWMAFALVPERCGRNMGRLLVATISLPAVLQRLLARGRVTQVVPSPTTVPRQDAHRA